MFTRERHRRGVVYFGPYANAKKVRETLDVLNRVFPVPALRGAEAGASLGDPVPRLPHRPLPRAVRGLHLEGGLRRDHRRGDRASSKATPSRSRPRIEERMRDAAAEERFEEAARLRNRLFAVRHLAERQAADKRAGRHDRRDRDRNRRRPRGRADLPAPRGEDDRPLRVPPRERRRPGPDDRARGVLSRVLRLVAEHPAADRRSARRGRPRTRSSSSSRSGAARASRCVRPSAARSGACRSSPTENAALALASEAHQTEQRRLRRVEALEELREALNLESLPIRIECFDISNIQGESVVGSMVVFQDAVAKKAHYRKFGVQSLDGQDDFAAMAEVVSRRFARLANPDPAQHDESFSAMPNLVVIDGGKGQLSAALAAMQAFDLPRVAVIALAKKEEEVYLPGQPERRSACPGTSRASSSCSGSATRRTASRSASTGSAARRARSSRSSTRCAGSARLAAGRSSSTSAHPTRSSRRRRRSWRACRSCRRRPPARSTRSCTRPGAGRSRPTGGERRGPRS